MDKKQKKLKISIIDILIILVIVALIAAAAVILKPMLFGNSRNTQMSSEILTIEFPKQEYYMTENIVEGDMTYDAIKNGEYGKVISYEVKPATETVVSETDGVVKIVEIPERYDIYVKLEASPEVSAGVGKFVTLYCKSFKSSGYVVGLERELNASEAPVEKVINKEAIQ